MNKVFKLHSQCIPVKGYNRGVLYDLNRNDYELIPNNLVEFLHSNENFNINQISELTCYLKQYTNYYDFLISKDFIFEIDISENELFPKLEFNFQTPSYISNTVIYLGLNNYFLGLKINEVLCTTLCFNVIIYVNEKLDIILPKSRPKMLQS